jgi:hypothetical protein
MGGWAVSTRGGSIGSLLVASLLALVPPAALAQTEVLPGYRVRLTTAKGQVVGTMEELTAERVTLSQPGGQLLTYRLGDVRKVEVSLGKRRSTGRGALWGGIIGAAAGLGVGAALNRDNFADWCGRGCLLGIGGLGGAAVGAAAGAALGSIGRERWRPARIAGIGVSFAF